MKNKKKSDRPYDSEFVLSGLIYKQKSCEVCLKKHNEAKMILCDRCEDAYHAQCIKLDKVPDGHWICELCQMDISRVKRKKLMDKRQISKYIVQQCYYCNEKMSDSFKFLEGEVQFSAKLISLITCSSCNHKFHSTCFSTRPTAINCTSCEQSIREMIPKGFSQFVEFVKDSQEKIASMNYIQLEEGLQKNGAEIRCHSLLGLLAPQKQNDWRVITAYFASVCYAIITRGMIYTENLLIEPKPQKIETVLRSHKISVEPLHRLQKTDEVVYQKFKKQLKEGQFPPLEVRQDRKKGFYIVSTNYIPEKTIIAEYVGELITARESLNMINNESIFTLIRNPRSSDSLDIAPSHFANIAIFISGINNSDSSNVQLQNVRALKFSYKGVNRLILVTTKEIKIGQTLYLNYNGDKAISEYPTNTFVA